MKNKEKIIDLTVLLLVLGLIVLAIFYFRAPKEVYKDKVDLTIKVQSSQEIEKIARKQNLVYFNTSNNPVQLKEVRRDGANLYIILEANGQVAETRYIFNGQRVSVGQKAEIHSTFLAKGIITEVKNAKN